MAGAITWDHHGRPAKLHKKSGLVGLAPRTATPRHVHFTPPSSVAEVVPPNTFDSSIPLPLTTQYQVPQAIPPQPGERKKKRSLVARLFPRRSADSRRTLPAALPGDTLLNSLSPDPSAMTSTNTTEPPGSWHHYETYFPTYEPILPSAKSQDRHTGHTSYFPDYTPILSPSHPIHAYPSASTALAYALSRQEAEKTRVEETLGRSFAVHLPDLPRFAEYQAAATTAGVKGSTGWQAGKWGVEGWTGYGWAGEKLPDNNGLIFGAPMPPGVEIPKDAEKKKKGESGGEAAEENEQADQPEGQGGEAEGEARAGGGGASSGKKKKKKKK